MRATPAFTLPSRTADISTRGVAIFLCDLTGTMAVPWVEAGYDVVLVDPQHPAGIHTAGRVTRIGAKIDGCFSYLGALVRSGRVVFVMGFPPCTDVAVSGSKHFEAKRLKDPYFQAKAAIVAEQCRTIGEMAGCPYAWENPVSVFSSIFGQSPYGFHPYQYTRFAPEDNYTKHTRIWCGGGFVMPAPALLQDVADAIAIVLEVCGRMKPKQDALAAVLEAHGEASKEHALVAAWYPDDRDRKSVV